MTNMLSAIPIFQEMLAGAIQQMQLHLYARTLGRSYDILGKGQSVAVLQAAAMDKVVLAEDDVLEVQLHRLFFRISGNMVSKCGAFLTIQSKLLLYWCSSSTQAPIQTLDYVINGVCSVAFILS